MKNKILITIAATMISISACKKHDEDKNAPTIVITSPTGNQTFENGDTVFLKGTATDEELHELLLTVNVSNDTMNLFRSMPKVHEMEKYEFNEFFVVSKIKDSTYVTFKATASDHHDHSTAQQVSFLLIDNP